MAKIKVNTDLPSRNQASADKNRTRFRTADVLVVNILGSPGSGKTSLVEQTARRLGSDLKMLVIEGDVETERDAERIRAVGVEAVQIQTHGACHLDADRIAESIGPFDLTGLDLLLIENVGNLICPCAFDLGEQLRVVVASTTEGDDKPLKYPRAFLDSHCCVLNKIDLLPHTTFDLEQFEAGAHRANGRLPIIHTSCRTEQGIDHWCDWLQQSLPRP